MQWVGILQLCLVCRFLHSVNISLSYSKILTNQLLFIRTFSAFGEKGKFLVSGGNDASVKLWDWSKRFSTETDSNSELVLDIDVKKKVKAGSSVSLNYSVWLVIFTI
jgi:hypothetical protein